MRAIYRELGIMEERDIDGVSIKKPIKSLIGSFALEVVSITGPLALFLASAAIAIYLLIWSRGTLDFSQEHLFIALIVWLVTVCANLALRLNNIARRLRAQDAFKKLKGDLRPPVIYLRPFYEDTRELDDDPEGKRVGGYRLSTTKFWRGRASLEERLDKDLNVVGPFIAIGRPGDRLCPLGAARLYVSNEEWKAKVELLVRNAAAVVLLPDKTPGMQWELRFVASVVERLRLLIIVPNPSKRPFGYARVSALVYENLQIRFPDKCQNVDAFIFEKHGQVIPLTLNDENILETWLRPFIDQVTALGDPAEWMPKSVKPDVSSEPAVHAPAEDDRPKVERSGEKPAKFERTKIGRKPTINFVRHLQWRANISYLFSYCTNIVGGIFLAFFFGAVTLRNAPAGFNILSIITGVACLAGLIWFAVFFNRTYALFFLKSHPLGRALAAYGRLRDVARDINLDFSAKASRIGPLYLGHRWVCYAQRKEVMIEQLTKLIWAYIEEIKIDSKWKYQIIIWTRNGVGYALPMSHRHAETSMERLKKAYPWLYFEYSDEYRESWNADRDDFVAAADDRRKNLK